MKKQVTAVLALSLLFLAGCGQNTADNTRPSDTKPTPAVSQENAAGKTKVPVVKNEKFQASFSLANDRPTPKAGEEFTVVLRVSNLKQPATTVTAYLSFDPTLLEATTVSFSDSVFPTVFRNKVDTAKGQVEMSASSPVGQAGVTGDQNYYAEVKFKAKKAGQANITFNPEKTAVLLSDNTDVKPLTFPSLAVEVQ